MSHREHITIGYTDDEGFVTPLESVALVPHPKDNAWVAKRCLKAGEALRSADGRTAVIQTTILEGHRFAWHPIPADAQLLSWGLPFGITLRKVSPGEWLCNAKALSALGIRKDVTWKLPDTPNFVDKSNTQKAELGEDWLPGKGNGRFPQTVLAGASFPGFTRGAGRGVGTRNFVVVLGLTELTAGFAQVVADRVNTEAKALPNVDGVVAVAHTEGEHTELHNLTLLLRTLSGFIAHPNVGAMVIVESGNERHVSCSRLKEFYEAQPNLPPLSTTRTQFLTLSGVLAADLDRVAATIRDVLPQVSGDKRTAQPLSALSIALQCGGSDSFSGVTGNPLVGWVAKKLVKYDGTAVLAETPELVGAEAYILRNIEDKRTAERFIDTVERYKVYTGNHGQSAEGNPSGGNLYRGLYNITLKSLGAAQKKPEDVCLEGIVEYGERPAHGGYYFMDSPGNDLESIAGQVSSGCNVVFFVTGNGSITNFPFVPTIKVVTTTARFEKLRHDMDVNAGRYVDGTSMDELGESTFDLLLAVASGQLSAGERSGHYQVQIWRNWHQTDADNLRAGILAKAEKEFASTAIPVKQLPPAVPGPPPQGLHANSARLALILPTSLCSSTVARQLAQQLNEKYELHGTGKGRHPFGKVIDHFVAIPHTEGCGGAGGEKLTARTLLNHLKHANVELALLLEHGCEKMHNDYYADLLQADQRNRYGWASLQQDGGNALTQAKVEDWFLEAVKARTVTEEQQIVDLAGISINLESLVVPPDNVAVAFAHAARAVIHYGGSVIISQSSPLLESRAFTAELLLEEVAGSELPVTLSFATPPTDPGLHVMHSDFASFAEQNAGLVGTGVLAQLCYAPPDHSRAQTHPMVPTLHITAGASSERRNQYDIDLSTAEETRWVAVLVQRIYDVLSHKDNNLSIFRDVASFQLPRGPGACSL